MSDASLHETLMYVKHDHLSTSTLCSYETSLGDFETRVQTPVLFTFYTNCTANKVYSSLTAEEKTMIASCSRSHNSELKPEHSAILHMASPSMTVERGG